jgi:hypothetical protein
MKPTIADAGNTLVPAYLALQQRGLHVSRDASLPSDSSEPLWVAENSSHRFIAEDFIALLGLVALHETRGDGWQASDQEIDSFITEHGVP